MGKNCVAVITGDVNASSRLAEQQARRLERQLEKCYEEVAASLGRARLAGFTTFRGDSWQFVVRVPRLAVLATLLFRALLIVRGEEDMGRKVQTSAAIGFGNIDYLPTAESSAGGGDAYRLSGKKLDTLRRRLPGMGAAGLAADDGRLDSLLGLIDALVQRWTALQARAVSHALRGCSQAEIAAKWSPPVSQQAVNKHLKAAGWQAIEPALEYLETTIEGCIDENNI